MKGGLTGLAGWRDGPFFSAGWRDQRYFLAGWRDLSYWREAILPIFFGGMAGSAFFISGMAGLGFEAECDLSHFCGARYNHQLFALQRQLDTAFLW